MLGRRAGFQVNQACVAALRAEHRQHRLGARRVNEQSGIVGLDGDFTQVTRADMSRKPTPQLDSLFAFDDLAGILRLDAEDDIAPLSPVAPPAAAESVV